MKLSIACCYGVQIINQSREYRSVLTLVLVLCSKPLLLQDHEWTFGVNQYDSSYRWYL